MYSRPEIITLFSTKLNKNEIEELLNEADQKKKVTVYVSASSSPKNGYLLTGNTKGLKDLLKENGYTWNNAQQGWVCANGIWNLTKKLVMDECKKLNLNVVEN